MTMKSEREIIKNGRVETEKGKRDRGCSTDIYITIYLSISESDVIHGGDLTLVPSLSLAAVFVLVSTIFIIVVVLLARSRARALRQLKSSRESTQRGNVTYEEINLPQVDIDTSENVAYGHVPKRH